MKKKIIPVFAVIALFFPTGTPAAAQDGDVDWAKNTEEVGAAKVHFEKGVEFFNEENWEKALRRFQKSFNIKPHWKTRYNIGLCYLKLQFWAQAMTEMTLMVEEGGKNVPPDQLKKVNSMVDSLKDKVGILRLEGELESVEIHVDGKPIIGLAAGGVLFLNPGEHRVEVRANDNIALSEDVVLTGGQEKVIEVEIPKEAFLIVRKDTEKEKEEGPEVDGEYPPPKKRMKATTIAAVALAAAAGAVLIGGTGAGINAIVEKGKQQDAYDAYITGDETDYDITEKKIDEHYNKAKSSALACTILLSAGGGLAVAALVTFLYPKMKKEKPETSSSLMGGIKILPGPGSLVLTGHF